ncbi:hypothetical protein QF043_001472 [Pseudomonas sp. W3I7]|uniref:bacteriocin immunity protein n=1 Tax=Pseudomonas sp. W3I7 TaxID=3042292 RepID=UPI00278D88D8|nr:bacteriocin immunity protein [Pseudomonas sp. W3I7]MDQ0702680.1 hypothetical protein [Pseudomonas sp. W3I7]
MADLLDAFCEIARHPAGTDLIYYPGDGADDSAEGIAQTIKERSSLTHSWPFSA